MEPIGLFIILILVLAVAVRLLAGWMDGGRVERYIREQGGEVLEKKWSPFGPGWYGEKDARIYLVTYRDNSGNVREAYVKTSALSGVYLTDDILVKPAPRAKPAQRPSLEEENARLKERIRELESARDRSEN